MRANVVKTVVNSVPHEGIDAVGVETTSPRNYAVTSWKSA